MVDIKIEIVNADKLMVALNRFPKETAIYLKGAGLEAGADVINSQGLNAYPPATQANFPPTPYYIRGRGTETRFGNRGESERLGTQNTQWKPGSDSRFDVTSKDLYTIVGNRASYAPYVIGEEQAQRMAIIGWRRLLDVAIEKIDRITETYNLWVNRLLKDLGLI